MRVESFHAGVERAVNRHSITTTNTSEWTKNSRMTATVDASRLKAAEGGDSHTATHTHSHAHSQSQYLRVR